MTDPTTVITGGRLLAPIAGPATAKLARKLRFRFSVSRRVSKKVDFKVPGAGYRAWLKGLTSTELGMPVEQIAGQLAIRLDGELCKASVPWGVFPDHLSRALRLVELTYPAIAAALGDSDRAERSEAWEQSRSTEVRELLLKLAGPGADLSAADLAAVFQRRSDARRSVRLQAFGLNENDLEAYFSRIPVLDVPPGQVVVLQGDFGAGKSEVAETWYRDGVANFASKDDAPVPLWLRALELDRRPLEDAMDGRIGPRWRDGRGARVVVDGLDETDVTTASAVLDSARELSKTYSDLQVLLTARPGILKPADDELVEAELMSPEDALALLDQVSGECGSGLLWTDEMRTTICRPFFALAAGAMLGRNEAPRGEADLIRSLVEHALERPNEVAAVTGAETREVLTNAAVSLTATGQDGLSFAQRQTALSSRLVDNDAHRGIVFALPIFQHWFAAQALLEGSVSPGIVVADRVGFGRWRWAAAVAALSAPSSEVLDDLMAVWVAGNAGAAGWLVKETFEKKRTWRIAGDPLPDPTTSGPRYLRALRTWADGLGPLAWLVLPRVAAGPVRVGAATSGNWVQLAISSSRPAEDESVELTTGAMQANPGAAERWASWIGTSRTASVAWPWALVRDQIAKKNRSVLGGAIFPGSRDGIWRQEWRYDLSRRLMNRGSLFKAPIAATDALHAANTRYDSLGRNPISGVSLGGRTVRGVELEALILGLAALGGAEVESHLPAPDVPQPSSGLVWDMYSAPNLMAFEVEVYGRACEAYDEAIQDVYSSLNWSMPSEILSPFGVILGMRHLDDGSGTVHPQLTAIRVPMSLMSRFAPTGTGALWSTNERAVIGPETGTMDADRKRYSEILEAIAAWVANQDEELVADPGWSWTGADDMTSPRPASAVAANWLHQDLHDLGLAGALAPTIR